MTLILTLGNRDQVIQISDRRLTDATKPIDEESNKAGVLICANARALYGLTGVARVGNFLTSRWLLKAFHESAPPDFSIQGIISRFRDRASHDFRRRTPFRELSPSDRRLTLMFSGYIYEEEPPFLFYALVSNFQDFSKGSDHSAAWDHFRDWRFRTREVLPPSLQATVIQRIGMWPAMKGEDVTTLRKMLEERKPAHAIIGKAVDLLREMADRTAAGGQIGRQISSVTLSPDRSEMATSAYHSELVLDEYPIPDLVVETHPRDRTAVGSITTQFFRSNRPDIRGEPVPIVPKARRNAPCPCGSGRKYKWCHGAHR